MEQLIRVTDYKVELLERSCQALLANDPHFTKIELDFVSNDVVEALKKNSVFAEIELGHRCFSKPPEPDVVTGLAHVIANSQSLRTLRIHDAGTSDQVDQLLRAAGRSVTIESIFLVWNECGVGALVDCLRGLQKSLKTLGLPYRLSEGSENDKVLVASVVRGLTSLEVLVLASLDRTDTLAHKVLENLAGHGKLKILELQVMVDAESLCNLLQSSTPIEKLTLSHPDHFVEGRHPYAIILEALKGGHRTLRELSIDENDSDADFWIGAEAAADFSANVVGLIENNCNLEILCINMVTFGVADAILEAPGRGNVHSSLRKLVLRGKYWPDDFDLSDAEQEEKERQCKNFWMRLIKSAPRLQLKELVVEHLTTVQYPNEEQHAELIAAFEKNTTLHKIYIRGFWESAVLQSVCKRNQLQTEIEEFLSLAHPPRSSARRDEWFELVAPEKDDVSCLYQILRGTVDDLVDALGH